MKCVNGTPAWTPTHVFVIGSSWLLLFVTLFVTFRAAGCWQPRENKNFLFSCGDGEHIHTQGIYLGKVHYTRGSGELRKNQVNCEIVWFSHCLCGDTMRQFSS